MDSLLLDSFVKLLGEVSTPAQVRALEAGGPVDPVWSALSESGFLDALLVESQGGAGLDLSDVAPLLLALGAHAVALPVAETMAARALLGAAAVEHPGGPVVLADFRAGPGGLVPTAACSTHALADMGDCLALFAIADLDTRRPGIHGSLALAFGDVGSAPRLAEIPRPAAGLRAIAAVIRAASIAGAAGRVLDMTVAYAGERLQFGKPIGKQQAVQQQLAVMAERSVAARMAALIGCSDGLDPRPAIAAVAKQVTSAAAIEIANIAHAVHGAIGISEEYDLQLFTRRLHEWRMADGSESWWAARLGEWRLQSSDASSVDYIRGIECA